MAVELYSNCMKPVALPPGRDRLLPKPAPTGSSTMVKTTGTLLVDCSSVSALAVPTVTITSRVPAQYVRPRIDQPVYHRPQPSERRSAPFDRRPSSIAAERLGMQRIEAARPDRPC